MADIEFKRTITIYGEDGKLHCARFRVREKESKTGYIKKIYRYLYLAYRDGTQVKEVYVAKLENK